MWLRRFDVPAGDWEYKAPVNDAWDENYGANGQRNGANIPLSLSDPASVKFYFDYGTKWITSNRNATIAVAPGSFQSELGCPGDWQPECATTHLGFDPGDEVWQATFNAPAGSWEYKAALNDGWSENYGPTRSRAGRTSRWTCRPRGR